MRGSGLSGEARKTLLVLAPFAVCAAVAHIFPASLSEVGEHGALRLIFNGALNVVPGLPEVVLGSDFPVATALTVAFSWLVAPILLLLFSRQELKAAAKAYATWGVARRIAAVIFFSFFALWAAFVFVWMPPGDSNKVALRFYSFMHSSRMGSGVVAGGISFAFAFGATVALAALRSFFIEDESTSTKLRTRA